MYPRQRWKMSVYSRTFVWVCPHLVFWSLPDFTPRYCSDWKVSFFLAHHSTGVRQYLLHVWIFHSFSSYLKNFQTRHQTILQYNVIFCALCILYGPSEVYMVIRFVQWLIRGWEELFFFFKEPIPYIIIVLNRFPFIVNSVLWKTKFVDHAWALKV